MLQVRFSLSRDGYSERGLTWNEEGEQNPQETEGNYPEVRQDRKKLGKDEMNK